MDDKEMIEFDFGIQLEVCYKADPAAAAFKLLPCTVSITKGTVPGRQTTIKIKVTSEKDLRLMYYTEIDSQQYLAIKADQTLSESQLFERFPDYLAGQLQKAAAEDGTDIKNRTWLMWLERSCGPKNRKAEESWYLKRVERGDGQDALLYIRLNTATTDDLVTLNADRYFECRARYSDYIRDGSDRDAAQRAQIESLEREVARMKEIVRQSEVAARESLASATLQHTKELERQRAAAEAELTEKTSRLTAKASERESSLVDQVSRLTSKTETLTGELQREREQRLECEGRLRECTSALAAAEAQVVRLEAVRNSLQESELTLNNRVRAQDIELSSKTASLHALEKQLADRTAASGDVERHLADLASHKAFLNGEVDRLKAVKSELEAKLTRAGDELAEGNACIEELHVELEDKAAKLRKRKEIVSKLKSSLDESRLEVERTLRRVTELEGLVREKDGNLARRDMTISQLESELSASVKKVSEQQLTVDHLHKRLSEVEGKGKENILASRPRDIYSAAVGGGGGGAGLGGTVGVSVSSVSGATSGAGARGAFQSAPTTGPSHSYGGALPMSSSFSSSSLPLGASAPAQVGLASTGPSPYYPSYSGIDHSPVVKADTREPSSMASSSSIMFAAPSLLAKGMTSAATSTSNIHAGNGSSGSSSNSGNSNSGGGGSSSGVTSSAGPTRQPATYFMDPPTAHTSGSEWQSRLGSVGANTEGGGGTVVLRMGVAAPRPLPAGPHSSEWTPTSYAPRVYPPASTA